MLSFHTVWLAWVVSGCRKVVVALERCSIRRLDNVTRRAHRDSLRRATSPSPPSARNGKRVIARSAPLVAPPTGARPWKNLRIFLSSWLVIRARTSCRTLKIGLRAYRSAADARRATSVLEAKLSRS